MFPKNALIVIANHRGRGTRFYDYDVLDKWDCYEYFEEKLWDLLTPNEELEDIGENGTYDDLTHYFMDHYPELWSEDGLTKFLGDEQIYQGFVVPGIKDQYLIIPDPNSNAGYSCEIDVVPAGVDIDSFIKDKYMKDQLEEEDIINRNSLIPKEPLDWTANTTYNCIAPHYKSQFWGWVDGANPREPFLIDYTLGFRGKGLVRYNLH